MAVILSNVKHIDASTLALWSYWWWQIECFFKLLKSAEHHLESWQQESVLAIAKRLLVAELRVFLIKLSGRQMRHKKEFTNPALLAGMWVFLSMLEIMEALLRSRAEQLENNRTAILRKSCVDAYGSMATVETSIHLCEEPDESGIDGRAGISLCL